MAISSQMATLQKAIGVDIDLDAGRAGGADAGEPIAQYRLEAHVAAGQGRFRGIRQSAGWDPAILTQTSAPAQPGLLADPAFRAGVKRLGRCGLS